MKTPVILALAGAVAIGVGLSSAAGYEHSTAVASISQTSSQNNAITPRVTPGVGSAPTAILPTVTAPLPVAPAAAKPSVATSHPSTPRAAKPILPKPMDRIGPVRSTADGHPVVYLTFDDGPSLTHTARILAVLRRHHARATFFVEGRFAHRYPQLIAAELAAGDSIGSHTWSHPHLPTLSAAAIRKELLSTQRYLRSLGVPAQCFRPPFGETNAVVHRVEAAMGIHEYLWTTETKDWTHASSARDLQRADAGLRPGAIIVFHDGHGSGSNQTVAAVDQFLTRAQAQGYIALPLPC